MTLYTAKLEVVVHPQKSVFFFSSLFGTQRKPSILDTPLRVKNDSFRGKMPLTTKFACQEEMQGIHLYPDTFLKRAGRTKDDLGLRDDHYFNGTHFTLKWEPVVKDATNALIQETLEEFILLLPKDVGRLRLLCSSDTAFMTRLYKAVSCRFASDSFVFLAHPNSIAPAGQKDYS